MEGICLTAAEDICWTTVVTACLRSEVSQAYGRSFRGLPIFGTRELRAQWRTDLKKEREPSRQGASRMTPKKLILPNGRTCNDDFVNCRQYRHCGD